MSDKVSKAMRDPVEAPVPTYKDGVGANDPGIQPRSGPSNDVPKAERNEGKAASGY